MNRMSLAQNWRRRGLFDEVAFIFPNAPMIPITVVRAPLKKKAEIKKYMHLLND